MLNIILGIGLAIIVSGRPISIVHEGEVHYTMYAFLALSREIYNMGASIRMSLSTHRSFNFLEFGNSIAKEHVTSIAWSDQARKGSVIECSPMTIPE